MYHTYGTHIFLYAVFGILIFNSEFCFSYNLIMSVLQYYFNLELLEEFSPVVERLGFDENFVDLTEMVEKRLQQLPRDEIPSVTVSGHVYNNQGECFLLAPLHDGW